MSLRKGFTADVEILVERTQMDLLPVTPSHDSIGYNSNPFWGGRILTGVIAIGVRSQEASLILRVSTLR